MLFSEPKIPQSHRSSNAISEPRSFSALQRAENSSIKSQFDHHFRRVLFQCSSASRKFLNRHALKRQTVKRVVSVLFSEPKIPQSSRIIAINLTSVSFSALQRAENSSINTTLLNSALTLKFQCSSASRKFLNLLVSRVVALPHSVSVLFSEPKIPQSVWWRVSWRAHRRFSALQRAENSSISEFLPLELCLFVVSVLFSEPKIPQFTHERQDLRHQRRFSALQRAENSSIGIVPRDADQNRRVSVLFSEPKIPQYGMPVVPVQACQFQCSSASRKFLNRTRIRPVTPRPSRVSVLFSEPKIPQY